MERMKEAVAEGVKGIINPLRSSGHDDSTTNPTKSSTTKHASTTTAKPSTTTTSATTTITSGQPMATTEVHEVLQPAVTREHIRDTNLEEVTTAVTRDLHQAHYQTRVQPVLDREVLPAEHVQRELPVTHKELRHDKSGDVARALEQERSSFRDTTDTLPAEHTVTQGPTIIEERRHHHVYETVQPVIEKEVVRPTVTHTTVPVHERIEKDPTVHPKTVQPVMTMEEFLRRGGSTEGGVERRDVFEGEPVIAENGGADKAWDASGHHVEPSAVAPGGVGLRKGVGIAMTEGAAAMMAERGGAEDVSGMSEKERERRAAMGHGTGMQQKLHTPPRSGSPLTAEERERVVGGIGRSRSPLASPGLHSAGKESY